MEKLAGLTHLFVTVLLGSFSAFIVIPAITDVTMSALCPGKDECSLAIYLSGFQQAVCVYIYTNFSVILCLLISFFFLSVFYSLLCVFSFKFYASWFESMEENERKRKREIFPLTKQAKLRFFFFFGFFSFPHFYYLSRTRGQTWYTRESGPSVGILYLTFRPTELGVHSHPNTSHFFFLHHERNPTDIWEEILGKKQKQNLRKTSNN